MQNCKTILTFLGGILLGISIWVASDVYNRYKENICMSNDVQEFMPKGDINGK